MTHRAIESRDSLGRVGRLTLKELRETLRDRRTIVTLVLMPLLVYPLLSLGFKQLLAGSIAQTDPRGWRMAAASEAEAKRLAAAMMDETAAPPIEPANEGEAVADAPAVTVPAGTEESGG